VESAGDYGARAGEHAIGAGAASRQQRINEVSEPICLSIDLGQKIKSRFDIPPQVGATQAANETPDLTQPQAEFVRSCHQELGLAPGLRARVEACVAESSGSMGTPAGLRESA